MLSSNGNDSSGAAESASEGSPSRTRLFVPPPDQPWTGAELARAIQTDTSRAKGSRNLLNTTNEGGAAANTTTIFSFPFNLPGSSGVTKLPALSSLLSRVPAGSPAVAGERSTTEAAATTAAASSHTAEAHTPAADHSSLAAPSSFASMSDGAAALSPSFPHGTASKTSFPAMSVSGVTQVGVTAADAIAGADSQVHSLSSVSSDTTVVTEGQAESPRPHAGTAADDSTPRSPLHASGTQAAGFTDLFVGLERPRLHRRPRPSGGDSLGTWNLAGIEAVAGASLPSSAAAGGSSTSHNLFSLVHGGTISDPSVYEDVAEDEAGAHTPTVYRSPQLPHWWRSIVTPSVGTRVGLRPNTPRLEFWWIDRLGSEAYELIQVILKHAQEGTVVRECGESAVVVEFHIPAELLTHTSFAVWRPRDYSATSQKSAAATSVPAPVVAAKGGGGEAGKLSNVDGVDVSETMAEHTADTSAPPPLLKTEEEADDDDDDERDVANPSHTQSPPTTPLQQGLMRASQTSAVTGASSIFTVGRRTDTYSTNTSEMHLGHPRDAFPGLPELVQADMAHTDSVERDRHHLIATPQTSTATAGQHSPSAPRLRPRAGSAAIAHPLFASASSTTDAADREETSVPCLQPRSSSADVGNSNASRSPVDRSTSVVTAGGAHSDPFVVERRCSKEPSLTRVLATTPGQRKATATPAMVIGAEPGPSRGCGGPPRVCPSPATPAAGAGSRAMVSTSLRTPVTPGEKGYSPDASDADNLNDTSVVDSHDTATADGSDRSATPPFAGAPRPRQPSASPIYELPTTVYVNPRVQHTTLRGGMSESSPPSPAEQPQQQPSAEQQMGGGDENDSLRRQLSSSDEDDPSLMHVEPLPKSDDESVGQRSMEFTQQAPSQNTFSYFDPFPKSKTYGEWLRTNSSVSPHPSSASFRGPSPNALGEVVKVVGADLVAAAPPWSHDDPNETTNFLGKTTSVKEVGSGNDTAAAEDDSVVVRLSLPASVCIPVVAVRLHAMQLLHPLLQALTIPLNLPLFTADNAADDEDGMGGALLTAAHVSPFTSELMSSSAMPDYNTAVHVLSTAIQKATEGGGAGSSGQPATTTAPPAIQPRDLSILYTIRSHLYFHMAPEYLYHSLRDAERALASCRTQEHVSNTYEVLTSCLISFGHTAQVERVSAHLRHRCRTPTPLITRLGRVTQVMVSYGTLFLHQQLSPSLLRPSGNNAGVNPERGRRSVSFAATESAASSPLDGRLCLLPAANPTSRTAATAAAAAGAVAAQRQHRSTGGGPRASGAGGVSVNSFASATAMPLVVVGGGIVDPPADWGRHRSPSAHGGSQAVGVAGRSTSRSPTNAAAAASGPRRLPYEVCPLLLGYYGKSLHRPNESTRLIYPPPLSPSARGTTAAAAAGESRGAPPHGGTRPSSDVCHRRLFLLETLFPSVMPVSTASRLQPVPVPVVRPRAMQQQQQLLTSSPNERPVPGSHRFPPRGGNADGKAGGSGKADKRIKPEDFMYDRDSMFALLANTAETAIPYGTVSMRYFCRHIRLSATRRILKGETVLLERPALMLALWPLPPLPPGVDASGVGGGRPGTAAGTASGNSGGSACPAYCAQCGRQRLTRVVHCPGRCGSTYCSEACRKEALRLYHIVECSGLAEPSQPLAEAGNGDDDDDVRVRRAVAAVQAIFAEWAAFLHAFAKWETPCTRATTPATSCSPSASTDSAAALEGDGAERAGRRGGAASPLRLPRPPERRAPPPILAVTGLRAVCRLVAMVLCVVLPVETLPQLRTGNEALLPTWTEERAAVVRTVARTLRYRGLMVPAAACGGRTNLYCTGVDPHHLLLLEVMLQQLSVPFFADFSYTGASTVWEALEEFPSAVARRATPAGGGGKSINAPHSAGSQRGPFPPFLSRTSKTRPPPPTPGQRLWFVELTIAQREELMGHSHRMLQRLHEVVRTTLADVFVLPRSGAAAARDTNADDATLGAPQQWTCGGLLGFLPSTRVFEELLDFCLSSCAVVYPHDVEPDLVAAGVSSSGSSSPSPSALRPSFAAPLVHADRRAVGETVPAVPLAVMSPWTCLTVDLHPFLGHGSGGVIYSRFMVEHEQRRRMIAYCAAAASRRGGAGGGGVNLGASGYGSGLDDDSFLSIHSMASASAAAVLGGSAMSPVTEDLAKSGSLRDEWNIQMLEEAASRSCGNLHLSLVHSPPSSDATRPPTVAVVMTAKKTIQLGDVLWWESQNFGEYLHPFF